MSDLYRILKLLNDANLPGEGVVAQVEALLAERERWQEARRERPDRDRLLEAIDVDRSETLLMLADDALDRGADKEAQGWGWLAQARKWPEYRLGKGWFWRLYTEVDSCHVGEASWLPRALFDSFLTPTRPDEPPCSCWQDTPGKALQEAVDAIAAGRSPVLRRTAP